MEIFRSDIPINYPNLGPLNYVKLGLLQAYLITVSLSENIIFHYLLWEKFQ